ncbi:MAG: SurA N-terminal domain-containing protein [Bacillota bacterium]|nr:SurA N-terminal domain-containing protein [Bacillota bacterium]
MNLLGARPELQSQLFSRPGQEEPKRGGALLPRLLLLVLLLALGGGWFWWSEQGDWVLRVNGVKVSRADWENETARAEEFLARVYGLNLQEPEAKQIREEVKKEVLQQLVDRALLYRAAVRAGIEVIPAEVEARVAEDEKRSGGPQEFQRILNTRSLTRDQYRAQAQELIMIEKLWEYVTRNVTVDEEEIRLAFSARRGELETPEQVKVGHILVKSESEALALIRSLDRGADFRELAVQSSLDPGVSQNKGILGYIARDDPRLPENFRAAAFQIPVGSYSREPVRSELGYHVLFVFEKKAPAQIKYEEVRDALRQELLDRKKNEVFLAYLEGLRKNSRLMYRF